MLFIYFFPKLPICYCACAYVRQCMFVSVCVFFSYIAFFLHMLLADFCYLNVKHINFTCNKMCYINSIALPSEGGLFED